MSNHESLSQKPTPPKLRIAFVDDEASSQAALRRRLREYRSQWDMHFFERPDDVLEHLRTSGLDVIVSDLHMPLMPGDVLLDRVRREFPGVLRFLMTARSADDRAVRAAQVAHRTLFKPFEGLEIERLIEHAAALRAIGVPEELGGLIGAISKGPLFPVNAAELVDPLYSVLDSSDLVPAKLLAARVFEQLEVPSGCDPNPLWALGSDAAEAAAHICKTEGLADLLRAHAVMACLLHPLELLLLARYGSEALAESQLESFRSTIESDTHRSCPLAAYTLGLWGFPDAVTEAVAYFQIPSLAPTQALSPLTITHIACASARASRAARGAAPGSSPQVTARDRLDLPYLEPLGFQDKAIRWVSGIPAGPAS